MIFNLTSGILTDYHVGMDLIETLRMGNPDLWWERATHTIRNNSHLSTEHHYIGGNGAWSVKRKHKAYIESVMDALTVPRKGRAAIVGGPPGAGKSRMLPALFDPSDYFVVDPDDIKDWLIESGLAPEVEGLTPRETAPLLHVESTALAKKLSEKLASERVNIIWPLTFSALDAVQNRVQFAKKNGYDGVHAAYVLVDLTTSTRRVKQRYAEGMKSFIAGEGHGGRFIDLENVSRTSGTAAFDSAKNWFDSARVIDNDLDLI